MVVLPWGNNEYDYVCLFVFTLNADTSPTHFLLQCTYHYFLLSSHNLTNSQLNILIYVCVVYFVPAPNNCWLWKLCVQVVPRFIKSNVPVRDNLIEMGIQVYVGSNVSGPSPHPAPLSQRGRALLPSRWRSICPSDLINSSVVCRESRERLGGWNDN